MLGLVLMVLAAVCFLLAAANQELFGQPPADLVAWGLLLWVLSVLLGGVLERLGVELGRRE